MEDIKDIARRIAHRCKNLRAEQGEEFGAFFLSLSEEQKSLQWARELAEEAWNNYGISTAIKYRTRIAPGGGEEEVEEVYGIMCVETERTRIWESRTRWIGIAKWVWLILAVMAVKSYFSIDAPVLSVLSGLVIPAIPIAIAFLFSDLYREGKWRKMFRAYESRIGKISNNAVKVAKKNDGE